jgi:hypothetical protein
MSAIFKKAKNVLAKSVHCIMGIPFAVFSSFFSTFLASILNV